MSTGPAKFTIPILAVIAFASMLGWLGVRRLYPEVPAQSATTERPDPEAKPGASTPTSSKAAIAPATSASPEPTVAIAHGSGAQSLSGGKPDPSTAPLGAASTATSPAPSAPKEVARSEVPLPATDNALAPSGAGQPPAGAPGQQAAAAARPPTAKAPGADVRPSFDVVRVEPSGESVIAGRAAAGATVDLMRNGEPMARAMADTSGLFAIVPPALPPGSQEISLRTIAPDGSRARSNQSVTVVIADNRDRKPLVTVTAPDQPTVVLSSPDEPVVATMAPSPARSAASTSGPAGGDRPPAPPDRAAVRIASVETQGAGRLFVSGTSAPGATIRLYLNDAFVAPGATGRDGKLAFSIERGIRPGAYHVRLDDVDPVSGAVKSRAEVPFSVPESVVASADPEAIPPATDDEVPARPRASSDRVTRVPPGAAMAESRDRVMDATATPRGVPAAGVPNAAILPETGFASLQTDPGQVVVPEVNTAIVSRGDSLWQISRRTYGHGIRYTVIFDANTPQIRNPDLIYPGQIFVLPIAKTQRALR